MGALIGSIAGIATLVKTAQDEGARPPPASPRSPAQRG